MGASWDSRVAEYVDSPDMRQRRRQGDEVSARIVGTTGIYRVAWDAKRGHGTCSCPSDRRPCKHIEALRLTWQKRPTTFKTRTPSSRDEFAAHDKRLQQAVQQAQKWFAEGRFESMGDAAIGVADTLGLDGDYEVGETGELVYLLEQLSPEDTLWDWQPQKPLAPEREEFMQELAKRVGRRFEAGLMYPSMASAVDSTSTEFDLEEAEAGRLHEILRQSLPSNLRNWESERIPDYGLNMEEVLKRVGLLPRIATVEGTGTCSGCKRRFGAVADVYGLDGESSEPSLVALGGKKVHADFVCISRSFGSDHPVVQRIEAALVDPLPEELLQHVAKRIRQRFEAGLCGTMDSLINRTTEEYFLIGANSGKEASRVDEILLASCPTESLNDWRPKQRSAVSAHQALKGLDYAPLPDGEEVGKACVGCHARFGSGQDFFAYAGLAPQPPAARIQGHLVHADLQCISMAFGPDSQLVLDLEAAMAVQKATQGRARKARV
jgi:hypothetical protein